MKIPLTQGKFAIVGPRDYEYLSQFKWHYNTGYAMRTRCPRVNGKSKTILMHRVILERMGCVDFKETDHIDRNRLNNQRSNLRPATRGQNQCNHNQQRNNTSGYTGVYWFKRVKKWRVNIMVCEKSIHLGYFTDKLEAAKAYNVAAKKYHGKFAKLNPV